MPCKVSLGKIALSYETSVFHGLESCATGVNPHYFRSDEVLVSTSDSMGWRFLGAEEQVTKQKSQTR